MLRKSLLTAIGLATAMLMLQPPAASAQVYGGVQGVWGSDTDAGIGARVLGNIEDANLEAVGSFNYYFPDDEGPGDDVSFWEVNANLFYHFHLPETSNVLPYLGGGLNVSRLSNGASDTEAGLNLGGGFRFPLEDVSPYVEGRFVAGGHDQVVLTLGLMFGHAHFVD